MSSSSSRVLIVERDPSSRSGLEALLRQCGHQVDAAASPGAGRERAAVEHYDVLVLDLGSPQASDATELLAIARAQPHALVIWTVVVADGPPGPGVLLEKPLVAEELLGLITAAARRGSSGPGP